MKMIPVTGLAFLCALALRASTPPLSGLPEKADRGAASSGAMLVDLDVPYVTNGHPRQKLDVFVQASEVKNQPLIIYIHGGAFKTGSKNDGVPSDYLSRGYAVASIDYRLSGDAAWPAQIEDCKAAVRWLRANAARYGIDPGRFAAWGASAGGHLAAMLGTTGGEKEFEVGENLDVSSRVQAVVDYFGPTDFLQMDAHRLPNGQFHDPADSPESALIGGPLQQNKDKAVRANPITYVSGDDPPFLICHGDADPLVPHHQSVLLEAALRRAGVPVTFYTVKGGGHGRFGDPKVPELTKGFLDDRLNPVKPGFADYCVMETSLGTMTFELFDGDAPLTSAQFKRLVRAGFYHGKDFYRVVRGHVIQAGGGDAPKLPPEFNARPHVFGTLGLGRTGDEGSGDSEIYVCVAARPHLDGKYTVFGRLVDGAEALEKIATARVEEKWEGPDGAMAMHKPLEPVVIRRARIEARQPGLLGAKTFPLIRGLTVRYFYKDPAAAARFYGRTLGLPQAGPGLFRLSETSTLRVGRLGEAGADSGAPKTATLSFVTDEVDGWYAYLKSEGVVIKHGLADAKRHPTRGFVAVDPEGYLLEFETFLDRPQNSRLRDTLARVAPLGPDPSAGSKRPAGLRVRGNILWLYYADLEAARLFTVDKLSAGLLVDQGFAKVMAASPSGFIGLVDGAEGLHRHTERKAVRIAFQVEDPSAWASVLTRRGLVVLRDPKTGSPQFSDPGGYIFSFY